MSEIQFQDTFGCEPWLLGRLSDHGPLLSISYLIGGVVTTAWLGWPFLLLAGVAWANDLKAASGTKEPGRITTLWAFDSDDEPAQIEAAEDDAIAVEHEEVEEPAKTAFDSNTYGFNPFGGNAPTYKPDPSYNPELTDFEKEMEAQVNERVEAKVKNQAPATMNATGIVNELITLEDGFLRSWFITGLTGSGKGIFSTFALLLAKRNLAGCNLWGVDPKADKAEFKRWAIIPEHQRLHFDAANPNLDTNARKRIEEGLKDLFNRFYQDESPYKILWLDELPAIASTVSAKYRSQLISFVSRVASMGRSRGMAVWVGSNAVGLRENGLSKSGRDFFHEVYLVTQRSANKVTGHASYPGPKLDPSALQATGRAAWASTNGDTWFAVPTTYNDAINELPQVAAPSTLGAGIFKGHEGAVGARELAEDLAEQLEELSVTKLPLAELREGTCMEGMDLATVEAKVIPALKTQEAIICLKKQRGVWYVSLPKDNDDFMSDIFSNL